MKHLRKNYPASTTISRMECPAKYRKLAKTRVADRSIKQLCIEVEDRYEMRFRGAGPEGILSRSLMRSEPAALESEEFKGKSVNERIIMEYMKSLGRNPEVIRQTRSHGALQQFMGMEATRRAPRIIHKMKREK